jgi:thiamine-monophosphate kinase
MDEFKLIDYLTEGFPILHDNVVKGVGDDCAVWKEGDVFKLLSTDTMVEGDHFIRSWLTPEEIGWRLLESNVSDIAAMGGTPQFVFLSIVLNKSATPEWVRSVYDGIKSRCDNYGISLLGGNTTHGDTVSFTVTIVGETSTAPIYRSGAVAGDLLCVTGTIGAACIARILLTKNRNTIPKEFKDRFARPVARVEEGKVIAKYATSMIDISDGIASESRHLAKSSGCGVVVDPTAIPYLDGTPEQEESLPVTAMDCAFSGGEDFELMFTVSPANYKKLQSEYTSQIPLTIIGHMTDHHDCLYVIENVSNTLPAGFDHFRENINQ